MRALIQRVSEASVEVEGEMIGSISRGLCVFVGVTHTDSKEIAEKILTITDKLQIPFIFKGSYKKANRSRLDSFTGIGDIEALKIL